MHVPPIFGEFAAALDMGSAALASVSDLLPLCISGAFVVVPDFGFESEIDHRLLPVNAVIGGLAAVAFDSQQVSVLVEQGRPQLFGGVKEKAA